LLVVLSVPDSSVPDECAATLYASRACDTTRVANAEHRSEDAVCEIIDMTLQM